MNTPDTSDKWREQAEKILLKMYGKQSFLDDYPQDVQAIAQSLESAFNQGLEQRNKDFDAEWDKLVMGNVSPKDTANHFYLAGFLKAQEIMKEEPKPEQRVSVGDVIAEADKYHVGLINQRLGDRNIWAREDFKAGFRKAQSLAGDAWPSEPMQLAAFNDWFYSERLNDMSHESDSWCAAVAWLRDWKARGGK